MADDRGTLLERQYRECANNEYINALTNDVVLHSHDNQVKLAFIGDVHLNNTTPRSRIDDFPSTLLDKLSNLRLLLKERGVNHAVFLGDFFHKPQQLVAYVKLIYAELLKFLEDGITLYSIIGNHDITYDRLDTFEKSALGFLMELGVIKHFREFRVISQENMSVYMRAYDYSEPLEPRSDYTYYNIAIAHMFYNFNLDDDSIMEKDLKHYGYNMYILGHDHADYPNLEVNTDMGKVKIIRPGALSRATTHSYNITRTVNVDIMTIGKEIELERVSVPCKPAEEIFSAQVIDRVSTKELAKEFKEGFNDLVTQLYHTAENGINVYDVLDGTSIDPRIRSNIQMYLESHGILRKATE